MQAQANRFFFINNQLVKQHERFLILHNPWRLQKFYINVSRHKIPTFTHAAHFIFSLWLKKKGGGSYLHPDSCFCLLLSIFTLTKYNKGTCPAFLLHIKVQQSFDGVVIVEEQFRQKSGCPHRETATNSCHHRSQRQPVSGAPKTLHMSKVNKKSRWGCGLSDNTPVNRQLCSHRVYSDQCKLDWQRLSTRDAIHTFPRKWVFFGIPVCLLEI